MQVTVRLLKPFMARPVGTEMTVGRVEADLLTQRGAAETLPAEGDGEAAVKHPPGPPKRKPAATTPPQNKAVANPAGNSGAPPRGRLLPQNK